MQNEFDILIVGAGISGIGAAFHIQKKCPTMSYAILESRDSIGGTWDLFRYPGIRSDSDMYTLGFPFHPWKNPKSIADGPSILAYLHDTAKNFGIESQIRCNHKVVAADWSSHAARWTLKVQTEAGEVSLSCRFLIMCCGYYDYENGYTPEFPGRATFKGQFIHPQFWDEKTDYTDKNVVVIGSGATAVTIVPELAKSAKKVFMLQRSPSYITALPSVDSIAEIICKLLPTRTAFQVVRWKNIVLSWLFYRFCRKFPRAARWLLLGLVKKNLRNFPQLSKDFSPNYDPWRQRLCLIPDGDLFKALNSGQAEMVTDQVETFTDGGIRLKSGRTLPADIIVSATGLNLKLFGGVPFRVDGQLVDIPTLVPYKGTMMSGVPNLGMVFGYTNASWTLKCDLIGDWLARIIRYMQKNGYTVVCPDAAPDIERLPMVDFSSGYFERAKDRLPKQGNLAPWKVNQNYFADLVDFRFRRLQDEGLLFYRT
jgi:cation diffusion facilitator CzcD-associated flavoprotein CzcO